MRLIAEIVIVVALIVIGWETSFREHVGEFVPAFAKEARASNARESRSAVPSATISSGAWMWDPHRAGNLDRRSGPDRRER